MGTLMQTLMAMCMSTLCTFVTHTEPMIIVACTTPKTFDGQEQVIRSTDGKDLLVIQHKKCKVS